MDTNEKYKEYEVGILELLAEVWEKEKVLVAYKTTMEDFLSPMYALYKRYKSPPYKMSEKELQDYITNQYLNDFIVLRDGIVIGESIKVAEDNNQYEDLSDIEDLIGKALNKNGNTKKNEYEVAFEEVNHWEDTEPYDTYKEFYVYNYLYHDVLFKKIRMIIGRIDEMPTPIDGYTYDIVIEASIEYKEAKSYFNKIPKPYGLCASVSADVYNSRKAFEGSDFKIALEISINTLLDKMCEEYGGLKK